MTNRGSKQWGGCAGGSNRWCARGREDRIRVHSLLYTPWMGAKDMAVRGLKQSSSVVAIGFSVTESGANTFTQGSVDLNLSPLDREVFVVLSVNLDPFNPDLQPTDSQVATSLTTTSQSAVTNLSNSNCIANAIASIKALPTHAVGFLTGAIETPPATLEYIGIIATNDFFVQVVGSGNAVPKGVSGKLYGYRAVADASIFAALVQSEVLSA